MWRELGVADIESYIDRVGVELREAMQEAATGECSAAHIAPDVILDEKREREGRGARDHRRPLQRATRPSPSSRRPCQPKLAGRGLERARAFASEHRGLVLSTVVPLAIVLRYPAQLLSRRRRLSVTRP